MTRPSSSPRLEFRLERCSSGEERVRAAREEQSMMFSLVRPLLAVDRLVQNVVEVGSKEGDGRLLGKDKISSGYHR